MDWPTRFNSRRFRVIVLALAVLALIYTSYTITLSRAVPDLAKAKARIKAQKLEVRTLTTRLESSKSQQIIAEQEASVMRRANQLLREEESNRQAEINRLQGELDFYQRLAGTSGAQDGLAVYHLALNPTGSERVFHFVLTLTQNLRRSAIISGTVRLDLEGTSEDRPLTLPWSQVTDGSQPEPTFRFKYFQQLEGYLALPEHFQPSRLQVTLEAKGQSKPVNRSFDWNALATVAAPSPATPAAAQEAAGLERELGRAANDPLEDR